MSSDEQGPGRNNTSHRTYHGLEAGSEEDSQDDKDEDQAKPKRIKWSSIPPNSTLTWHACFPPSLERHRNSSRQNRNGTLDCARLVLPMDWSSPPSPSALNETNSVTLAIIRLRANPSSKLGPYLGPLFFNPGGPGGSGIYALLDHGEQIQTIAGDNHDLVTWDPRGVGASLPRIDCWGGASQGEVQRKIWELGDPGVVDAHEGVLFDAYARAAALGRVCESRQEEILRHSSSPYHARDMLEILDQIGGPEHLGKLSLRYWGFSYGTVLGGTFAAMYPDRVERMVNDGNVDYREWYTGSHYNFLRDADKVMSAFYRFCHFAGKDGCAFWDDSPENIRNRLEKLLGRVKMVPVAIIPPSSSLLGLGRAVQGPELVTYSKVKRMISTALYQPILRFKRVAQVLAGLEEGNGLPFYEYTILGMMNDASGDSGDDSQEESGRHPAPPSNILCPLPDDETDTDVERFPLEEDTPDASSAIMCSDAMSFPSSNDTTDNGQYYTELSKISASVASVQISFKLSCVGRSLAPIWKPFNLSHPFFPPRYSGHPEPEVKKIKTSHPILFIANGADNVTPLVSARNNSELFEDSVVLVQEDSWGHTTLAAPSACTASVIRRYFQTGEMPDGVCKGDGRPFFDEFYAGQGSMRGKDEEQGLLRKAIWKLGMDWRW
ncbi:TAP-like domain containing protein [Naviculisporaceae sp. PSN 640]